jgi:hypothetical protein
VSCGTCHYSEKPETDNNGGPEIGRLEPFLNEFSCGFLRVAWYYTGKASATRNQAIPAVRAALEFILCNRTLSPGDGFTST